MTRAEILERLQDLFRDFFENEAIVLNENFESSQMEEWDSVAHIQIVLEIETEFDVMFDVDDISKLNKISVIIDKILEQKK